MGHFDWLAFLSAEYRLSRDSFERFLWQPCGSESLPRIHPLQATSIPIGLQNHSILWFHLRTALDVVVRDQPRQTNFLGYPNIAKKIPRYPSILKNRPKHHLRMARLAPIRRLS